MSNEGKRSSTTVERALEWMRFDPVKFGLLVEGFTLEEEGAAIRIVRHLWNRGPLPEAELKRLSKGVYGSIQHALIETDGGLTLAIVEEARTHGKRRVAQRVEAGIASAAKRGERSTTVERTTNDRSTDVLSNSLSKSNSSGKGIGKVLFGNCSLNDPEAVKTALPELVSEGVNLEHYRKAILNWSDTKNELRTERGWLATFRQWTDKDREKKELKMLKPVWNPRA